MLNINTCNDFLFGVAILITAIVKVSTLSDLGYALLAQRKCRSYTNMS